MSGGSQETPGTMMNHARVFKKTAPNGKITLYVERRELCITENGIQPLQGILFVDANYVKDRKVYGQFVLTFRYGREDEEEVMGLRFCNEACLQAQQLWPMQNEDTSHEDKNLTPLQDTLVKRLGAGAVPFSFSVSSLAPPSVTLLPARSYAGAPIGTNYDLRIFVDRSVSSSNKTHSSTKWLPTRGHYCHLIAFPSHQCLDAAATVQEETKL